MARIELPEVLTPEQKAAADEVINGPRGFLPSVVIGWLRHPELARRLQNLGLLLRYDTSLDPVVTELAILVCARHWTSHTEWKGHKAMALATGMDPRICADIAARRTPVLTAPAARAAYDLASALLRSGRPTGPEYHAAIDALGEKGVMEVIGIVGYYSLASFTINTFELGLPEDAVPELEDPEFPGV
ncbi:MAG: carboxymuconolactone decarboxylase family protein [Pseudomonadota bacterium]